MDDLKTYLQRYTSESLRDVLANAVACDWFRKLNVDERPAYRAVVEALRPDIAMLISERYPQHWK